MHLNVVCDIIWYNCVSKYTNKTNNELEAHANKNPYNKYSRLDSNTLNET